VARLYKRPRKDAKPKQRRRLVVLAPIAPAPTGNGLAMRSELFRRAAAQLFDVSTVVVPVAGELPPGVAGSAAAVVRPDPAAARAGVVALAADSVWRERLARARTLPLPARAASPGLADAVAAALSDVDAPALHVVRSYLAPLGIAVAERLGAPWVTLDLDEDDAALADAEEADAYHRLLDVFGGSFEALAAASPAEALTIGSRHGLAVQVVPNAVDVPPVGKRVRGDGVSLLLVGNLTYGPNADAARILAESVLPAVQRRLGSSARVTLVGPVDARVERLRAPGIEVTGFVPDLVPSYAAAAAVVVPLRVGGGTRIKLLEAFAHGVPVVASRAAAAGLEVAHERHLLLADDPDEVAAAVERLVSDAPLARRLAAEGRRLVETRYSTGVALEAARELFRQAAERGQAISPRSSRSRSPASASSLGGVERP
jgi:glycosyltransferase involved in cell wall biosynthesis